MVKVGGVKDCDKKGQLVVRASRRIRSHIGQVGAVTINLSTERAKLLYR